MMTAAPVSNSSSSNEPIPFVDYYCACSAKQEKDVNSSTTTQASTTTSTTVELTPGLTPAESAASITGRHLLSTQASNYLYPLSRLYFCEDCHQIRCPSCVQDEIVSYYCPNCLFEVSMIILLLSSSFKLNNIIGAVGSHSKCKK
jgi:dynactin-4